MPDLVAGTRILAADFPPGKSASDGTLIGNIASTSYITGSPVVDLTFIAPTSGRVKLTIGGGARDNQTTPAFRAIIAPQVFEGADATGTEIVAPSAALRGVMSMSTASGPGFWSRVTLLEGLKPEQTYYARVMFRVDGGSSVDILHRDLLVEAAP